MGRNSFLLWIVQGPKIFPFDSLLSLSSRWSNCSCCRSAPWPPQELAGEHRSQEQINNSPQKRKNRNRNRNQSNASPTAGRRRERGDPPSVGRRPPRWRPAATPPPPRSPPPTPSLPNKARTFETRPRPLEDVKLPSPSSYPLHHLSFYEFPLFSFPFLFFALPWI